MMTIFFSDLLRLLDDWHREHPWSVQPDIGTSVFGAPLRLYRVGTGNIHIHLNAAMHANEWLTAFAMARLGTRLCCLWQSALLKAEEEWEQLLAQFTLWMVPLVNPDGVRLALDGLDADHPARQQLLDWNQGSENFSQWKANGNGVDLNDQFPAGWERERKRRQTDHPGPRDYGGAAPLSEPEARALARHARLMPFAAVLAFHTQGAEIYWNYADFEPSETERMAEQMGECAGLCAVKLADSDAGFKDWFIQEFRRPGFTVELGRGTNPLPYQDLPVVERQMELTVLACLRHLACATAQVNEP